MVQTIKTFVFTHMNIQLLSPSQSIKQILFSEKILKA